MARTVYTAASNPHPVDCVAPRREVGIKIVRSVTALALGLCLAAGTATAAQEGGEEPGDGWTEEYDCDEKIFLNEHKLEEGGSDAGGGEHGWWAEDCTVHQVF